MSSFFFAYFCLFLLIFAYFCLFFLTARVAPLHKSDDKLQVENYRPISVLPVLSKVVERVVHSQLNAHLHQPDFLYQHQYCFRRAHSTEQAITRLTNWVLESVDEGKVTGLLFVDISKAFDPLNHKVLLRKLEHLGLSERSLTCYNDQKIISYFPSDFESVFA